MIRLLQTAGVLAWVAAGAVGVLCARQLRTPSSEVSAILASPSIVGAFVDSGSGRKDGEERTPLLVAEAQALALHLDPPPPPEPPRPTARKPAAAEPVPLPRPAVQTSPKFKVLGTSCSETDRERSIALIAVPGTDAQWMREGQQVGHFVIHEIQPGLVVCLAGEQLHEIAIEADAAMPSLADTGEAALSLGRRVAAGTPSGSPPAGPSRRPTRRSSRTVGSARTRILD